MYNIWPELFISEKAMPRKPIKQTKSPLIYAKILEKHDKAAKEKHIKNNIARQNPDSTRALIRSLKLTNKKHLDEKYSRLSIVTSDDYLFSSSLPTTKSMESKLPESNSHAAIEIKKESSSIPTDLGCIVARDICENIAACIHENGYIVFYAVENGKINPNNRLSVTYPIVGFEKGKTHQIVFTSKGDNLIICSSQQINFYLVKKIFNRMIKLIDNGNQSYKFPYKISYFAITSKNEILLCKSGNGNNNIEILDFSASPSISNQRLATVSLSYNCNLIQIASTLLAVIFWRDCWWAQDNPIPYLEIYDLHTKKAITKFDLAFFKGYKSNVIAIRLAENLVFLATNFGIPDFNFLKSKLALLKWNGHELKFLNSIELDHHIEKINCSTNSDDVIFNCKDGKNKSYVSYSFRYTKQELIALLVKAKNQKEKISTADAKQDNQNPTQFVHLPRARLQ